MIHSLLPSQPGNFRELPSHGPLHEKGEHALQMAEHILLLHKGKLHIHLGELRLAVRAQIFIPKAPGNLIVLIHAAHHEQLFEDLRGLGQRIEGPGMHAAGHQVIPRPFRRAFSQNGRLHLQKPRFIQILPHSPGQLMAEAQIPLHLLPP